MTYLTKNLEFFSNLDGMQAICAEKMCVGKLPQSSLRDASPLWDGAFGIAVQFPAKVQSLRARQRLPLRGSWQNRQVLTEGVQSAKTFPPRHRFRRKQARQLPFAFTTPSRENAMPERPQTLRHCSIKNNFSAIYAQSNAERIKIVCARQVHCQESTALSSTLSSTASCKAFSILRCAP